MEKSTAVQKLHEISIEYDFSVPIFTITSLGYNKTLPPFNATCAIFKNHVNYKCESEPASTKKTAKQNVARIMLNTLLEKYIFSEQTFKPNHQNQFKTEICDNKSKLYKWSNACEKCYQRKHRAANCYNEQRNRNYTPN